MNMWTAKDSCKRLFRDSNAVQKRSPVRTVYRLKFAGNAVKNWLKTISRRFESFLFQILQRSLQSRSLTHAGTTDLSPKEKDLRIQTSSRKELSHKKRDLLNGQGSNRRSLSGNGYRVLCSRRPESRASASGIRALKISAAPYGYGEDFKPDH